MLDDSSYFERLLFTILLTIGTCHTAFTQEPINGYIEDKDGDPIPNLVLRIGDETIISNSDGHFYTTLQQEQATILISTTSLEFEDFDTTVNLPLTQPLFITLKSAEYNLEEVDVIGHWVGRDEPFTASLLTSEELAPLNLGQDIPILLQSQPSLTYTSDAGNGVGYTGFRIRGTDPTRINISIDGIPINEAESQLVYWVNMPDFASEVDRIQVQRGVGPSANGTGVFGATVNLITKKPKKIPFIGIRSSYGSFNTKKHTLQASTGELAHNISMSLRGSHIQSDGYIDRAHSNLYSLYGSISHLGARSFTNVKAFYGTEETYHAWNGVPIRYYQSGEPLNTFNTAGDMGNGEFYDNQTDNYRQTHIHFIHNLQWKDLTLSLKTHYTNGKGYFEEYKLAEPISTYGIDLDSSYTDLIRRLWLHTNYAGLITQAIWDIHEAQTLEIGLSSSYYTGDHWGEVIWAQGLPTQVDPIYEFYRNDAQKWEAAAYAAYKVNLNPKWQLYADLQWRSIAYEYQGRDIANELGQQRATFGFLNPKIGINHSLDSRSRLFGSAALAQREPNRNDFVQAAFGELPKHEQLLDFEIGYETDHDHWGIKAQAYGMFYRDQLVLTGRLNEVGEYVRTNVPRSRRIGLELSTILQLTPHWSIEANSTISDNRIDAFHAYVDNWGSGEQEIIRYQNTHLAFSPAITGYGALRWQKSLVRPHHLQATLSYKYTGKQYLDNTSSDFRQIPGFGILNFHTQWTIKHNHQSSIRIKAAIQNLLDLDYVANGWSYQFRSPLFDPVPSDPHTIPTERDSYSQIGLYPQAGINFMIGIEMDLNGRKKGDNISN